MSGMVARLGNPCSKRGKHRYGRWHVITGQRARQCLDCDKVQDWRPAPKKPAQCVDCDRDAYAGERCKLHADLAFARTQ